MNGRLVFAMLASLVFGCSGTGPRGFGSLGTTSSSSGGDDGGTEGVGGSGTATSGGSSGSRTSGGPDASSENDSDGSASSSGSSSGTGDAGTPSGVDAAADTGSVDPLDAARQYNLQRLNMYRSQGGLAPLALDASLDDFAQAGSVELSMDHMPHQHFIDDAAACGCGVYAENQGDPNGWTSEPVDRQIDDILSMMMAEGPGGGHYENIMDPNATRLGVGIVNPGGVMYFTNDFGN